MRDQVYSLSQHGFARDQQFNCVSQQGDRILLSLEANADTLPKYPFPFALTIGYELRDSALTVNYKIDNLHSEILPFSIGGHPAFRCPILPHTQFNDYYLEFSSTGNLKPSLS